jgi:bacillolysin/thermolysin
MSMITPARTSFIGPMLAPGAPAAPVAPVAPATAPVPAPATTPATPAPTTAPTPVDGRSGRQTKDVLDGALQNALKVDPKAQYTIDQGTNGATFLSGQFAMDVDPGAGTDPDIVARAFFKDHGQLFGAGSNADLHLVSSDQDQLGFDHFRYQQYFDNLPVFGQVVVVHTQGKVVQSVGGHLTPNIKLNYDPKTVVGGDAALKDALAAFPQKIAAGETLQAANTNRSTLGVYTAGDGTPHLAYELDVAGAGPDKWRYYVDAQSGKVIDHWALTETAMNRETYDAKNQETQPGTLVRKEGDGPTKDVSVNAAHDGAKAVYDFYNSKFGRDGIDNKGMTMISTVHYGDQYNNAYWDGTQMVYGDGDGKFLGPLALGEDVVGHEMTHGVTERTAGLEYHDQPGALNESWSDTMGNLIQHWDYARNHPGAPPIDPKWLVGEDVFTPGVDGDALRSESAPGTAYKGDDQPANMKNYNHTRSDNGGVHTNSGIPNLAAFKVNQALGEDKTAAIWYRTQTQYMTPRTSFADAANMTVQAAADLYGKGGAEEAAVRQAWTAVGITPTVGG